jgi:hypothetical protein
MIGVRALGVVATLIVLSPAVLVGQRPSEEVRCNYTKRSVCDQSGCKPMAIGPAYMLVPPLVELSLAIAPRSQNDPQVAIRRCDDKGCTPAIVVTAESGVFLNAWKEDGGYMVKLATQTVDAANVRKGDFVEVASTLLTTLIGYGRCPW